MSDISKIDRDNFIIPSFGRRRDRGLSNFQKKNLEELSKIFGIDLPDEKINPIDFFKNNFRDLIVEIGFGHGEHLITNAERNQNYGFIGCEPFENGVADALAGLYEKNLSNVKIFKGDARYLLEKFEDNSVMRFYVLFPDPWTKNKHHKRRLLNEKFLKFLKLKIKKDGNLIIATDCIEYMQEIVQIIEKISEWKIYQSDLEWLEKTPSCFISTKYQQKALSQGKKCYYLRLY